LIPFGILEGIQWGFHCIPLPVGQTKDVKREILNSSYNIYKMSSAMWEQHFITKILQFNAIFLQQHVPVSHYYHMAKDNIVWYFLNIQKFAVPEL
jgi:hypothetical protein